MSERISSVLEDDFEILDPNVMDLEVETEDSEGSEFAKEKDLQNFLVKNLHMIEPGLSFTTMDCVMELNTLLVVGSSIF